MPRPAPSRARHLIQGTMQIRLSVTGLSSNSICSLRMLSVTSLCSVTVSVPRPTFSTGTASLRDGLLLCDDELAQPGATGVDPLGADVQLLLGSGEVLAAVSVLGNPLGRVALHGGGPQRHEGLAEGWVGTGPVTVAPRTAARLTLKTQPHRRLEYR